jgi:leucyl aminopeptidase
MLIYKKLLLKNDKFFVYNKEDDLDGFKIYIKNIKNKPPNIYIPSNNKYTILNILYDIAFTYKIENNNINYFENDKKNNYYINIFNKNKNINDYILLINNCINAIDLTNIPSNIATPKYMADFIKLLFKKYKDVKVKILPYNLIKKEKLNLLKAVGEGTYNSPYFVIVERLKKTPTTCIIGKGITFDAGGINLKTGNSIYDMKLDKLGACYGVYILKYLIDTHKDMSLVGLFPFTENIFTNKSLKPGDIIKSHSGKTVEILNADAEGRLVMADALSYSHKYKPKQIIDISTLSQSNLTCNDYGMFYTSNSRIKNKLETISFNYKEYIIGLPIKLNNEGIKSSVADIKNISLDCGNFSNPYQGTVFLKEFLPKNINNWIHFDISNELFDKNNKRIPNGKVIRTIIEIIKK